MLVSESSWTGRWAICDIVCLDVYEIVQRPVLFITLAVVVQLLVSSLP